MALGETRDVVGDFAPSGRRVKAPAVPSTGGVCVVVRTFKPHMGLLATGTLCREA